MNITPIANANSKVFEEIETNLLVLGPNARKSFNCRLGMFRILNQEDGDKRVVWDRSSLTEINDAKRLFDQLVEQGLVPYQVDARGTRTTKVLTQFDPEAEEIIFVPIKQMVGG